jgi:hypothetical protein
MKEILGAWLEVNSERVSKRDSGVEVLKMGSEQEEYWEKELSLQACRGKREPEKLEDTKRAVSGIDSTDIQCPPKLSRCLTHVSLIVYNFMMLWLI